MYGLLILNAIVPFVLIMVGSMLRKHPVSDMRLQNGYNTPVSRRSQEHWDYGQKIAPGIFISIGKRLLIIEAAVSIVLPLFQISTATIVTVGSCIGIAGLVGGFFYTDSKIIEFVEGQRR